MFIRLGYVAITNTLENITSSSNLTYTTYQNLPNKEEKLHKVILSNLTDLKKIIIYNIKNNIHFYRLSSTMIPLSTHNQVKFDYITPYQTLYKEIGKLIKISNMRVDFHPNQFAVLNSASLSVVKNTIEILEYHKNLLDSLSIENPLILLHVGSNAGGKKAAMTRFIHNFYKLPIKLQKILALENDDKVFTVEDVLYLCETLHIPCVLDYHHYLCNHEKNLENLLPRILKTWNGNIPKMHFSSPKSKLKKEFRSHHEYINPEAFIDFLKLIEPYFKKVDIMLEAKGKDVALFQLVRQLKYMTNYEFIDDTSFYT